MVEIETFHTTKLGIFCDECHEELEAEFLDMGREGPGETYSRRLVITACAQCQEGNEEAADRLTQIEEFFWGEAQPGDVVEAVREKLNLLDQAEADLEQTEQKIADLEEQVERLTDELAEAVRGGR